MRTLYASLLLAVLSIAPTYAQQTAYDCQFSQSFTSATTGTAYANDPAGAPCSAWRTVFNTSAGISGISIQLETSPDNSTWTAVPNTVCSSTVQPPCVIDGANPTATTGSQTFSVRAYGRFVRLNVTSFTGSGTISTRSYGYKGLSASANPAGGGGGGLADPGSNGFVVRTALNTTVARTLTAGTGITITNPTGLGGNPTISAGSAALTTFQVFPWGNYQMNQSNTFTINSAHNVYVWPFMLHESVTLGHIIWHAVVGNPGGGGMAFAIFDNTKTLLGQTTPYTSASGAVYVNSAMASSITIGPGLFYFGFSADNTTVSFSLDGTDTVSNQTMNVSAQRTGSCANTSTGTGSGLTFPGTCGVVTDLTFNALPSIALEN